MKKLVTRESVMKVLKAGGYILVSVLVSEAVVAATGDVISDKIGSQELMILVNILLVAFAKEIRMKLPEDNKLKKVL